jgi:uncharacterized repeat protein (TIGR03803 family)
MNVLSTALSAGIAALILLLSVPQAEAATETVVYAFNGGTDGYFPYGGLLGVSGSLYGVTAEGGTGTCEVGCGTVFSLDPKTGAETVVHSFDDNGDDGWAPSGTLTSVNGTIYGTTAYGGTGTCQNGCGTVFSVDLSTGAERVIYSFQDNGLDGQYPNSGLINVNGTLYGTTPYGGENCVSIGGCGTVFTLDPTTGSETILYSFCTQENCVDGAGPTGPLLNANGTLYGTTGFGGSSKTACVPPYSGCGTLFSLTADTGAETTVYSFCSQAKCADGSLPAGGLININNVIYGAASWGGNESACYASEGNGCGTIFSVDLTSGTEKTVYVFCEKGTKSGYCKKGEQPNGSLAYVKGILFGTTAYGGAGYGSVFSIDLSTNKARQLHAFSGGKDGTYPFDGLIRMNGMLYGTTEIGGDGGDGCEADRGCGTVFSIKP